MVSDTITHVTLNTIDGVVDSSILCLEGLTTLRKLTIALWQCATITSIGVWTLECQSDFDKKWISSEIEGNVWNY